MLKPFSKFGKPAASLIRISGLDNSNCLVNIQAFRQSLFPRRNYMILRLQEMVGAECQSIRVEFAPELKLKSAFMADMVERKGGKIKVSKNGFQTDIGPFETLTLALTF